VDEGKVLVSSSVRNVDELASEISTVETSFVVVDHLGYLVTESSTEAYDRVYKMLVQVQRLKPMPIMNMVQSNRENKKQGGFLDKYAGEWSSECEKSASYLWTLNKYDPAIESSSDDRFPCTDDNWHGNKVTPRFFVCVWKDRNAQMKVDFTKGQTGIGAIRLEPNKLTGYYDQLWIGSAYQDRLWSPGTHKTERKSEPKPVSGKRVATVE
jgi:hypothetical protein